MHRVDAAFARDASALEDWGAPDALVQEFRESTPVIATPVVENTHVPGSILDLRTPIVRTPEPVTFAQARPVAVEPEPRPYALAEPEPVAFVAPEPVTFVAPEPVTFVAPEPVVIEPEPLFVEPEFVESERPAYVRPELLYAEPRRSRTWTYAARHHEARMPLRLLRQAGARRRPPGSKHR
jgi:hypothetical protein